MPEKKRIPRHRCTEVEVVLAEMRILGWEAGVNSHGHGEVVMCPFACECRKSVASTPKNCGNEAKRVKKVLKNCPREAI